MSRKQNPYHLWLGLPAEVVSPDFFQLLGISADATNDKQIAASARTNAEKLLDRLKQVSVKSESEKAIRDKLKSRIVTAHKTVSDPAKRKQYAAALASKKAGGAAPTVSAPPTRALETPSPQPPIHSSPEIPKAIPLAKPIDSGSPAAKTAPQDSGRFDGLEDEEVVRVRPVRARGKRSSVVPIVVTLLIITVIGGLVSLLAKYNNVFDVLAKRDQGANAATANSIGDVGPANGSPELVADSDAATEPLRVPENFQALSDAQKQDTDDRPADDQFSDESPDAKATGSGMMETGEASVREVAEKEQAMPEEKVAAPPTDAPEATAEERAASATVARVTTNMVRQALLRRDIPAAQEANQRIKSLIEGFGLPDQTAQLALEKEHATNEQMIAHLEVFLGQLRSAAIEMPGGQDVQVGKLIMSLVDANPTAVTLRRAGRNDVIPYTDLPVSVAIVLGEQGSKASIPKWNMAKAAALVIHSRHNPELFDKADPFLKQSISDGYDEECQVITDYCVGDMALREPPVPESLPADLTSEEVTTLLEGFRADNGYTNPTRVKPNQSDELLEFLLTELTESDEQRRAHLAEAIAIAAQHKQFDALLSAAGELYRLSTAANVKDTLVVPLNRCMRSDMSASQARHLVHTIIGLTKQLAGLQSFEEKAKGKLIKHAQTLVEEFKFSELAPKVRELAEQ